MRSPYFFVLIFNELETILKINKKYFEKSLQLLKQVVYLYQKLKQKQNDNSITTRNYQS